MKLATLASISSLRPLSAFGRERSRVRASEVLCCLAASRTLPQTERIVSNVTPADAWPASVVAATDAAAGAEDAGGGVRRVNSGGTSYPMRAPGWCDRAADVGGEFEGGDAGRGAACTAGAAAGAGGADAGGADAGGADAGGAGASGAG